MKSIMRGFIVGVVLFVFIIGFLFQAAKDAILFSEEDRKIIDDEWP